METLLYKAYESLNKDKQKKNKIYFEKPLRPSKEFQINDFNIPQSRQFNKTKEHLSKVLAFIDYKKHFRFSDGYTVMKISVKDKKLRSIYGSSMNISRGIQYMKEIGLIGEYNTKYQFNGYYERNNYCKEYVYSKDNEDKIKEYCKKNNINKYERKNNIYDTIVNNFDTKILSFEMEEVRFCSKLHLLKPDNYSVEKFEKYLTYCLYLNYPKLSYYQNKADYINNKYFSSYPELQITFTPTFTWSKGNKAVTKIGIRATNPLVSVKKEREENDEEWITYKDEILEKYNLKYEYDVKSSVPRVTYLLNNGEWLSEDVDLYKEMYERFIEKCPEEYLEWNKTNRNIFKHFHMPAYFDTTTKIAGHIKYRISQREKYNPSDWEGLDRIMYAYKESVEETVGTLKYDSEVFYHESCIYMEVLEELLESGLFIWQQYDGFYSDKDMGNMYERVKRIAEAYYKENIKEEYKNKGIRERNNRKIVRKVNNIIYDTIVNNFDYVRLIS
jgi:hypothetical protein